MDANIRKDNCHKCLNEIYNDYQKHGEIKSVTTYAKFFNLNTNLCKALQNANVIKSMGGKRFKWITDYPSDTMVFRVLDELSKVNTGYTKNYVNKNSVKKVSVVTVNNNPKLTAASNNTEYRLAVRKAYRVAEKYFNDENQKENLIDDLLKEFGTK